jgi:hypothetical protein
VRTRILALLMSLLAVFVVSAPTAHASTPKATTAHASGVTPDAFSVACNFNSVAQGRVDFPNGFTYTTDHSKIDTNAIRYRSINRTTGATATWKADAVWVQLYNGHTGHWDQWTTRGGTATDTSYVGPDYTWDPAAKNSLTSDFWNAMQIHIWALGYSLTCNPHPINF